MSISVSGARSGQDTVSGQPLAQERELPDICSGLYREIAKDCGLDVAKALYLAYAGRALKPPLAQLLKADHHLAQALGFEPARRFCIHWGGIQLEMPVRWLAGKELRDVVCARADAGWKINDIAGGLRVPRPSVQRILAQRRMPEPDLFE